jgi:hypothetical protein
LGVKQNEFGCALNCLIVQIKDVCAILKSKSYLEKNEKSLIVIPGVRIA